MTAETATAGKRSVGAESKKKARMAAIDRKGNTGATLRRLLGYMVGGEARPRFVAGVLVRLVALMGLTAMPAIIGQATNVISDPDGTTTELVRWAIWGIIAGAVYLAGSYLADRTWAGTVENGARIYSATDYHQGFTAMLIFALIALGAGFMLKETNCRNVYS